MRLELTELFAQVTRSLNVYDKSRPIHSDNVQTWTFLILLLTAFLTFPFFKYAFRNDNLTRKKLNKMDITLARLKQIKEGALNKSEEYLQKNAAGIITLMKDELTKLHDDNCELNIEFGKHHLSPTQIKRLALKETPSSFQSGLTLTIENCFELIEKFCEMYLRSISTTAQVNANLGAPGFSPFYYAPPSHNPASAPSMYQQAPQQFQPTSYYPPQAYYHNNGPYSPPMFQPPPSHHCGQPYQAPPEYYSSNIRCQH